ncbi:MAG TPA: lytic transglycosylase domain-containing protein [Blastocatellia bacterium]|nr:lytic transglycosylase domain-containing protein [Blastocatellia bacterium]
MTTMRTVRSTVAAVFIIAMFALVASAQESRPMSPPDHPPVPLTDQDQQRARAAELSKGASVAPVKDDAQKVAIPGRHLSTGNPTIDSLVYEAAAKYKLDPCLIISVMSAESGFNRLAVSPKGAIGLMQLMPATASRFGVKNIFDARENVLGGSSYLRWLLDRFAGDVRLALAGYNAGEGAVELYGYKIPPFIETQNYVQAIYTRYSRIHGTALPAIAAASAPVPKQEKPPTYNQIIQFTSSDGSDGGSSR